MDYGSILNVVGIAGTGIGGYIGGRLTGRNVVSQIASDTVDMLQAQVDLLKRDKEHRELEILDLTQRVAVLEGLVTQRAEVALVKDVVDRIAAKVEA